MTNEEMEVLRWGRETPKCPYCKGRGAIGYGLSTMICRHCAPVDEDNNAER